MLIAIQNNIMTAIKILSLNVRGLRNQVKRRALFLYLKNQKADFCCLQETFTLKEDEIPWASEWGGKIIFFTRHGTFQRHLHITETKFIVCFEMSVY